MNTSTKNLLLTLKNCSSVKLEEFYCKLSKKNINLLMNLYSHGLIQSFTILQKTSKIHISIRYYENKSIFNHLKFMSTHLKAKNISFLELSRLFNKRFLLFLTTEFGFQTVHECYQVGVGGKLLFSC